MVGSRLYVTVIAEDLEEATSDETDPVTMFEELSLESVESAGRINGQVNILVAYFSSEMDEINPADIEIRQVSNNKLFTVEKVTMTSDGLTATMTLTGTAAAAADTEYLQGNTPYRMIVKNGDTTLEKEFILPVVLDNAVVTAVDPTNEKISLGYPGYEDADYELGEGVTVDNYFELLGKTVTAEVDETGKITTYNVAKLKTVIGKFTYTAGTATTPATFKEAVSGTVYKTTNFTSNQSTYRTTVVKYNDKFSNGEANLAWGKLVLNPDNTIRTVQGIEDLPNSAYVTANDEGVIKNGASVKVNVKDFVIISGDETIEATDLEEGDVFIYSAADNVGYVYNNPISGTFTKDYGTKYVFAGKEYSQDVTDLKDQKEANLTTDAVADLIKAETEMTLYTTIGGEGVYAIGEAAALTSKVNLFVTTTGTSGEGDLTQASVTGFNPATEEMETYVWTDPTITGALDIDDMDRPDLTGEAPTLLTITVNAEDGTTVKAVAAPTATIDPDTATYLDGVEIASEAEKQKITKSTKLIGTDADNGMDPAKAKVVVYKNPADATKAWAASNFTVYDFSDWSGNLEESAVDSGEFDGTNIYGTLNKSVDFLLADGAVQTGAGAVGIEAGTPFVGFVTEALDGTSKRVKAITTDGAQTYETFYDVYEQDSVDAAEANIRGFVMVTPSKTFDDDDTIFSIAAIGDEYAAVATAQFTEEASNGATLVTRKSDGTGTATLDIASDALIIKKTVKNGSTSYAQSTATAIKADAPIAVYTAKGNNTIAKLILFADPGTAAGDEDAISTRVDLVASKNAERAAMEALTCTPNTTAKTLTISGTVGDVAAVSSVEAKATVAVDGRVATLTLVEDGQSTITITVTGEYWKATFTTVATVAETHTAVSFAAVGDPVVAERD